MIDFSFEKRKKFPFNPIINNTDASKLVRLSQTQPNPDIRFS
jgi:hypothetical protein